MLTGPLVRLVCRVCGAAFDATDTPSGRRRLTCGWRCQEIHSGWKDRRPAYNRTRDYRAEWARRKGRPV